MKKSAIRGVFSALVMAVSASIAGTAMVSPAVAQSDTGAPVILIVDQARLIANSKAGKSINDQLLILQTTANEELETQVKALVKEQEELKAKKETLPEDQFLEQAKRLAVAQNNVPVLRDIKVKELSLSEQRAVQLVMNEMRPILKEIVDERGATLLLDRSAVMYASQASDITDLVMERLDEKMQTVKVERVRLSATAPQADQAQ